MRSTEDCHTDHRRTRRKVLGRLVSIGGVAVLLGLPRTARGAAGDRQGDIVQPGKADKGGFMQRAFEMRRIAQERGDQAYGAVVVKNGRIVGEGISGVIVKRDPTAHGEMEAIRDASRRLGKNDLSGCEMYSSSKPCPMCETAAYWARISRLYFGGGIADDGPPRYPSC